MDRLETREGSAATAAFAWRPAPLADVVIDDAFWSPRLRVNRERTIPFQYAQCRDTGRIEALRLQWRPGDQTVPHPFWDSDVAKWIEAASYSLATHPDPALDAQVDEVIALLASAQQPDGYLNTYFTVVKPEDRWTDLRDAHELYCAGHLIEAGAAHFQATGKRSLLAVVQRYADHIASIFGREPGQKRGYCGHEEIELALVKLYRATGEDRYLRLAQYFVDERGTQPYYFDQEAEARGTPGYFEGHRTHGPLRSAREYNQAHLPVREQTEVVGHAVRAMYLSTAMADLAAETGDSTLRDACRRLWDHLCARRLYLTGGIGSAAQNEGFTRDYDLPNETAYAETCAAIGLVFWAHRMVQLEADGRYADVLEQALYNGVLSGVSLDGTRFFYENPLASLGGVSRKPWFGVACCPPNLARLLASLGQYIYSANQSALAVHLYVGGSVRFTPRGQPVTVRQETEYPWDGTVRLTISTSRPVEFALYLRRPGWCREAAVRVNDDPVSTFGTVTGSPGSASVPLVPVARIDGDERDARAPSDLRGGKLGHSASRLNDEAPDLAGQVARGYLCLTRLWSDGDTVELRLPMPVERVYAHPQVSADVGAVALQRGPLVYCLEEVDNPAPLECLTLAPDAPLVVQRDRELLGGTVIIRGEGRVLDDQEWGEALYRHERPVTRPATLTAVPYHTWDNRGSGPMRVWIREAGPDREG